MRRTILGATLICVAAGIPIGKYFGAGLSGTTMIIVALACAIPGYLFLLTGADRI